MKHLKWLGMRLVDANVDKMQVFATIKNVGIVINAGVNVMNCLLKVGVRIDLFGILVYVNVIYHVMSENA